MIGGGVFPAGRTRIARAVHQRRPSIRYSFLATPYSLLAIRGLEKNMTDNSIHPMSLIYCPCPDLDVAKRLGNALLDARLAGCINILPGMVSLYDWEGAREEAAETVLIAKTSAAKAGEAQAFIEREHPYDVPAVLTLPLTDVNAAYRDWLLAGIAQGRRHAGARR
jgi:periplasmic divalent cation tolerance protein